MSSQAGFLSQPLRLGSGVHSVVWRVPRSEDTVAKVSHESIRKTGTRVNLADELFKFVAIKVVHDNRSIPPHDIVREAAILQEISHPNIISFGGFVQQGPDAPYVLYMPLIPFSLTALLSSPLFTPSPLTGPYSALSPPVFAMDRRSPFEIVVKSLIYQLILAIAYLHSLDPPVAHRDINPSNVLVDCEGTVILIDFGIAWSTRHLQNTTTEGIREAEDLRRHPFDGYNETEENMCYEVATGPHRAPELLFSPRTYSATATDLWSLGTTMAEFFTPLRLISSRSPTSSPTSPSSDEEEHAILEGFKIPHNLKAKVDYRATWERLSLFNGNRGELGLAWSIFKLRGTPTEKTWPTFNSLPDANKIEFRMTDCKPLYKVLPHLPLSRIPDNSLDDNKLNVELNKSPLSLIDKLLAYPPASRLSAANALDHLWFSGDTILPLKYPYTQIAHRRPFHGRNEKQVSLWEDRTLGEWLEPSISRGVAKFRSL